MGRILGQLSCVGPITIISVSVSFHLGWRCWWRKGMHSEGFDSVPQRRPSMSNQGVCGEYIDCADVHIPPHDTPDVDNFTAHLTLHISTHYLHWPTLLLYIHCIPLNYRPRQSYSHTYTTYTHLHSHHLSSDSLLSYTLHTSSFSNKLLLFCSLFDLAVSFDCSLCRLKMSSTSKEPSRRQL